VSDLLLGVDQGTSSTRCVAVDAGLRERGAASVPVACSFPRPGRVEQDPVALAGSVTEAIDGALAAAGARASDVAAVGIANQTETFVVWDRETGEPVHPAIVWQDRRTDAACAALAGHAERVRATTGLELDATFPATKLAWLLDAVDGARAAAEDGRLAYGDVASWLLHQLGGGVHVCDAANAGRSLLCGLGATSWDEGLLELFGIPPALLPPVLDSDALDVELTGSGLRVRAATGDQPASLFGLRCWEPGSAKVTLGTGAFLLAQAGTAAPDPPDGVLASCAWRRAGETCFALEGFIPAAGAALDWFARLGALPSGPELGELLASGGGDPDPGVVCVPAFQGSGTPSWDASARGALFGLSLATSRADLARAVVDGILHAVADAVDAVPVDTLWVDGGLSRSDWIVDRLADLTGVAVQRTARADSTALGAATLAGLAAGVWAAPDELPEVPVDRVAEPRLADARRHAARERWARARDLGAGWDTGAGRR
jgi:glycerol kinase